MDRQAAQAIGVGHLGHQRMEGGGDRREMGEGRAGLEPADVAEGAAVAHAGQQHPRRIDVPAAAHATCRMRSRFGVSVSSPISAQVLAGRGRRDQDRAAAAGVAQPAPQEAAAIAAAAVQRHHQRPGAVGRVIFRHVEREAAAAAGLVVHCGRCRCCRCRRRAAAPQVRRPRAARDRRRTRLPAAVSAPADTAPPARGRWRSARKAAADRPRRRADRRRPGWRPDRRPQAGRAVGPGTGPIGQAVQRRAQIGLRRADHLQHLRQVGRVEVAGDETKALQGVQHGRDHRTQVFELPIVHAVLPSQPMSLRRRRFHASPRAPDLDGGDGLRLHHIGGRTVFTGHTDLAVGLDHVGLLLGGEGAQHALEPMILALTLNRPASSTPMS